MDESFASVIGDVSPCETLYFKAEWKNEQMWKFLFKATKYKIYRSLSERVCFIIVSVIISLTFIFRLFHFCVKNVLLYLWNGCKKW